MIRDMSFFIVFSLEIILTFQRSYDIIANAISFIVERSIKMRIGLNKDIIIRIAAEMADEKGAVDVTFKELAGRLGIKPPSLYKHFIGGLDELNKELMLYGWRLMDGEITKAVIGKAKDDAVIALCYAYRNFVSEHKGLYEVMQWYNMYESEEHQQASAGAVDVMYRALASYELSEEQKVHTVRLIRSFLQGFSTIEVNVGKDYPVPLTDSFDFALKAILNGIANIRNKVQ